MSPTRGSCLAAVEKEAAGVPQFPPEIKKRSGWYTHYQVHMENWEKEKRYLAR